MSILIANVKRIKTTRFTLSTYAKFYYAMWFRSMSSAAKPSYTKTVLLPQTEFPARHSGKKRVEMDSYLIEVGLFVYKKL